MVSEYLTHPISSSSASPFASVSAQLADLGYFPLPIHPHGKRPAVCAGGGRIIGLRGWQSFPDSDAVWRSEVWSRMSGPYGVGVRHSESFGAIDFDHSSPELSAKLLAYIAALPGTPVARRGKKGWARYFQLDGAVASAAINAPDGVRVVDILAAGRQSVIPPSIHPDTGKAYEWLTDDTLLDTPPSALPLLTGAHIEVLLAIIADHFGVQPDQIAVKKPANSVKKPANSSRPTDHLGDMALANLESWVPALDLARCRPKHGGFEAVATWRASGTGRDTAKRKRNLSITTQGIRDFGDDKGYSPVSLVSAALGISARDAWNWLADRLDYAPEPWRPSSKTATDDHREPIASPCRIPLADAQTALSASLSAFSERVAAFADLPDGQVAPQGLVKVSLGAGKSHAAVKMIFDLVRERPWLRILMRLPDHKLADQMAAGLAKHLPEGTVVTWKGRDQIDPRDSSHTMCRKRDQVQAVEMAGGSLDDVCRTCPFSPKNAAKSGGMMCAYKRQGAARDASVVLIAGDVSLRKLPSAIKRPVVKHPVTGEVIPQPDFDLVILDETGPAGLISESRAGLDVLSADLDSLAAAVGHEPSLDPWSRAALHSTIGAIHATLTKSAEDGQQPTAADFAAFGVEAEAVQRAAKAIWQYKASLPRGDDLSAMDPADIGKAFAGYSHLNGVVATLSRLCNVTAQALVDAKRSQNSEGLLPQVRLTSKVSEEGPRVVANLMSRMALDPDIADAPILLLDATPEPDLLRQWFHRLEIIVDLDVADGDGVKRIQVTGFSGSQASLNPTASHAGGDAKVNASRMALAQRLLAFAAGGDVGLIVPKGTRGWLVEQGCDESAMMHFGLVRGRNDFQSVAGLVVAGRVMPSAAVIERLASVIAGRPVVSVGERLPKRQGIVEMRDGTAGVTEVAFHPDPMAEAVRRSIADGERLQALGRGRAVRRTADRPLVELIIGDGELGLPVDQVVSWDDFKALTSWAGQLLANGVWPTGSKAAQVRWKLLTGANKCGLSNGSSPSSILLGELPFEERCFLPKSELAQKADRLSGNSRENTSKRASLFFRDQLRNNPAIAELVAKVNTALAAGERSVSLCGINLPLPQHTAPLTLPSARYATPTAISAVSVADLAARDLGEVEIALTFGDLRKGKLADLPSGIEIPALARMKAELAAAASQWSLADRIEGRSGAVEVINGR